ncbi:MAG: T9SS type A sorting domain-containing protein, partial [Bacteroidetes bacterium]|nr:T9SS type A sorting domain-containing protein [Fibrella sp.]
AGALKSVAAVEGSVQINTSPVEYAPVLTTAGLAPTADGGFVVLANDATNLYIIKKDANQNRVWSTVIAPSASQSNGERYAGLDILPTNDGGYHIFATHLLATFLPSLQVTKVNSVGTILWSKEVLGQERINSNGTSARGFTKVVPSPDGNYLIPGNQFGFMIRPNPNRSLIVKIDGEANLISSRANTDVVAFSDAIANPYEVGTYFMLGVTDPTFSGNLNGPTYPYKLQADGALVRLGRFTLNSQSRIASDGSGVPHYVIVEGYGQGGSDFIFTGVNDQNVAQPVWSRILGGSGADVPQAILPTGDGFLLGGTTTSTDGDIKGKAGNALATWVVKLSKASTTPPADAFAIDVLAYDCHSGQLVLGTTGGNGTSVDYRIAGLRDWAASNTFTIPPYQRQGTTFTLEARQTGQQVSRGFTAACVPNTTPQPPNPPTTPTNPSGFYLRTPAYDCTTGNLTALYSNGTGSPPEYRIVGLRDWGTSPEFTVPAWQRTGTTFTIEGRLPNGAQSVITFTTACDAGEPTPPTPQFPPVLTFDKALYACSTGQLTLVTAGGDGTPIAYRIPGLADWQLSPVFQVPVYQRSNPFMFVAYIRQRDTEIGVSVTAYCQGASRTAAPGEERNSLNAKVLPNPVVGGELVVEVTGVGGQSVEFTLTDTKGRVVSSQRAVMATDRHWQTMAIGQLTGGFYFLRLSTGNQLKVLKVMNL